MPDTLEGEIVVLQTKIRKLYSWIREQERYADCEATKSDHKGDYAIYTGSKIALHFAGEEMESIFDRLFTFHSK